MKAQQKPHNWSLGLVPRIILLSVLGVLLLGATVTAVAWKVLADAATDAALERVETNIRVAWDTVKANGTTFGLIDDKLTVGDRVLNGDFSTVDKIKSLVGGTATIFMNDQRISTNVLKPDGTRAIGTRLAPSPAYTAVFERKQSFRGEVNILGEPYMTAYDPIVDASGKVIGILYVGIKKADFEAAAYRTLWTIATATIAITLLAVIASLVVVRRTIARPLRGAIDAMKRLASGDLTADTPQPLRSDEIGEILKALAVFKEHGLEVARLRHEHEEAEARAEMERKAEMLHLAREFEGAVGEIVGTVSSSANELEASAGSLTNTASRSRQLAISVSSAAEEASANVQSVASATEEMASSVNEISRQVQESARIAQEAVEQAHLTNDRVGELSKAAARIGDVVELISTIAGQTNLLALNATIEAARAGDAGRGFAVVAAEVKALAEQTAKATSEIGQQISGIQSATEESVAAIHDISDTIGRMAEIASTIASAVEEQGAATQEIARNVQMAAHGTTQVTSNIGEVRLGAEETGEASSEVLSAAKSLSKDSDRLKTEVNKFLDTVRAA